MVFDYWRTATYYRSWLPQKTQSVNGSGGIFWKITCCAKIELTRRTSERDGTMEIKWWRFWLVGNRSDSLFRAQMSHVTALVTSKTPATALSQNSSWQVKIYFNSSIYAYWVMLPETNRINQFHVPHPHKYLGTALQTLCISLFVFKLNHYNLFSCNICCRT